LIRIRPDLASAYRNRGLACAALHDYDQAVADFVRAARLDPKSTYARHDRGRAVADRLKAIRRNPRHAAVYNDLAWYWAACPEEGRRDGVRALAMAVRACQLSRWDDWDCLKTLAAAHVELGPVRRGRPVGDPCPPRRAGREAAHLPPLAGTLSGRAALHLSGRVNRI
jgi:serine/threonine-protein kinase